MESNIRPQSDAVPCSYEKKVKYFLSDDQFTENQQI